MQVSHLVFFINMPSPRKRIGFLPRSEVQIIIDDICKNNKLSQSKVTGILVEEALRTRGVLNSTVNIPLKTKSQKDNSLIIKNNSSNAGNNNDQKNFIAGDSSTNDDIQMINDFIEFKLFKEIMNQNRKIIK